MVDIKEKKVIEKTKSVEPADKVKITKKMYVLSLTAAAAIGAGTATIADYSSKDAIVEQRTEHETFLLDKKDEATINALLSKKIADKAGEIQQVCFYWNDVDHAGEVNTMAYTSADKKDFILDKTDKVAVEKIFQNGAGCQAVKKRFGVAGCDINQACLFWNDVDHVGDVNVNASFEIDALIAANEED